MISNARIDWPNSSPIDRLGSWLHKYIYQQVVLCENTGKFLSKTPNAKLSLKPHINNSNWTAEKYTHYWVELQPYKCIITSCFTHMSWDQCDILNSRVVPANIKQWFQNKVPWRIGTASWYIHKTIYMKTWKWRLSVALSKSMPKNSSSMSTLWLPSSSIMIAQSEA